MANYVIESTFEHKGLKCVVMLTKMGFRNGYVGIPKSHPLYGKDYDKVDVEVHGGLTFNTDLTDNRIYPIETDEDLWWFGFDCAHCWDANDFDAVLEKMPEHTIGINFIREHGLGMAYPDSTIKTQQYVEGECKHLAEQLSDWNKQ